MTASGPSLKRHLTGMIVLVSTVPVIVIGLFLNSILGDISRKETEHKNLVLAQTFASDVRHFLEKQLHEIEEIHDIIHLKRLVSARDTNSFLETILKTQKFFSMILLLDGNGRVEHVAPYNRDIEGIDMSGQPFWRETTHLRTAFWSPTSISLQTGEPATILVLRDSDHAIAVYIDLSALYDLSSRIKIGTKGYGGIADQEGTIIAHRNLDLVRQQVNVLGTDFFRKVITEEKGVYRAVFEGTPEITSAVMVPETGWVVFVSEPEEQAFRHVRTSRSIILATVMLTIAIAFFISFRMLQKVLVPLSHLTEMTRSAAGGEYRQDPFAITNGSSYRELNELASDFGSMLSAVRDREEKLAESEGRYRSLFEDSRDGIIIVTHEGRFIDLNPAFQRMLGYASREELFALSMKDIYADPAEREAIIRIIGKEGYVNAYESQFRKKDGGLLTVLITSTPHYGQDGAIMGFRTTVRDITDQRSLEAQLRHAQKMEAVGHLAGGVAHDFNNILTAIIGYANLLKMKLQAGSPLVSYVDQVLASGERAVDLTRSLLAFSRKQIINPKQNDLSEVVQGVSKLLLRLVTESIDLKITGAARPLPTMIDRGQIEQVIMNLVANARDAMPYGGLLTIETGSVHLAPGDAGAHFIEEPGDYAVLSVADTGTGMDERTRANIFEPFFTTKEVGKGTGLGLAMVYGIVKQHGGYINVYSEPGKGSIFRIYLPLLTQQPEEAPVVEAPLLPEGGSETVLLAEDDGAVRSLLKLMLSEAGYSVITASDGSEAVSTYEREKDRIRLVLLDVVMPKQNGREAYDRIRAINPEVRAIFMSGYTDDIIHRHGMLDEGLEFVSKPVTPADLLKKVREVLDR